VVGVCRKFRLVPSAGPNVKGARPAGPARAGAAVFPLGSTAVEVDVVAAGGSLWIEVKAHQAFGAGSRRAAGASHARSEAPSLGAKRGVCRGPLTPGPRS
jgi:hypothetical protein